MQFGQKKTTVESKLTLIDKIYMGEVSHTIVQHTSRVRVASAQDEMTEYLNFSEMLRGLRLKGLLLFDKEDKTTLPSFTIIYPKEDAGYYQVVLNWCENMIQSELDKVTD
jgi:hypothetical protein